jgi:hypothetical protein
MKALKRMLVLCTVILALGAPAVKADTITVNFLNVTPLGGGLFSWNYQIAEDAQGEVRTGTVPGAVTSLVGPNTVADYFTLYDFAGMTGAVAPAGWASQSLLLGSTNSSELPTDSGAIPNVTFYYTGAAPVLGPFTLGGFSVTSTVGPTGGATGFWTSEDTNNPSLVNNAAIGTTTIATIPEPNSLWLLGSGLVGLAGFWLRRR